MADKISKIGLVTVTYNSAKVLEDFMTSVLAQDFQNFLLYVIDNASSDNTLAQLDAYKDSRIIQIRNPDNRGVAAGNNQGILAALKDGCSAVVLINNDTKFNSQLLSQMAKASEENSAGMVVPKMYYFDRPNVIWCAGGGFRWWKAFGTVHFGMNKDDQGQFDHDRWVDYTPTCCMLIRPDIFSSVGLMDEAYFVYSDDADFCYRAKLLGKTIYYCHVPALWHKVNSLTGGGESPFAMRYHTRNRVYFMRKHLNPIAKIGFIGLYALNIPLRILLLDRSISHLKLKLRAFLEGLEMPISPLRSI